MADLSKTPYLKLDPEYQRDVVWDETRASGLIASVMQGYFIPPIIFNVIEKLELSEDGSRSTRHYRICVDGKQRLSSLQKFIEGHIGVLDASCPPKKWFFCHPKVNGVEKQSNHNILSPTTQAFFKSCMFCCYEYHDLLPAVEETMFQLVQRGMPLTPAEKMRALSTPWANFAKQYEMDYSMVLALSKQNRASGFRQIMSIFCQIMEVMSPSGDKKKNREGTGSKPIYQASPNILTKLLVDTPSLNESVKKTFKKVFDRYQELLEMCSEPSEGSSTGSKVKKDSCFDPAPAYLAQRGVSHVKTFSPLEVVTTAILLLCHMDTRNNNMLVGDIMDMRLYLRQSFKDLRLNGSCWAAAFQYIDVELIQRRGGAGAVRRKPTGSQTAPPIAPPIASPIGVHEGAIDVDEGAIEVVEDEDDEEDEEDEEDNDTVRAVRSRIRKSIQSTTLTRKNNQPSNISIDRTTARAVPGQSAFMAIRSTSPAGASTRASTRVTRASRLAASNRSDQSESDSSNASGRVRTSAFSASPAHGTPARTERPSASGLADRPRMEPFIKPRKRIYDVDAGTYSSGDSAMKRVRPAA